MTTSIEELAQIHGATKQFGYRSEMFYCMTADQLMAFADAIKQSAHPIEYFDMYSINKDLNDE